MLKDNRSEPINCRAGQIGVECSLKANQMSLHVRSPGAEVWPRPLKRSKHCSCKGAGKMPLGLNFRAVSKRHAEQIKERWHQDIKNKHEHSQGKWRSSRLLCSLLLLTAPHPLTAPYHPPTHPHTSPHTHTHTSPTCCPQLAAGLSRMKKGQSYRFSTFLPGSSIRLGSPKWI